MNDPKITRVILVVMDGCGVGAAPDAAEFGDTDHPNTLGHIAQAVGLSLPTLRGLGLGRIVDLGPLPNPPPHAGEGINRTNAFDGATGQRGNAWSGRLQELSRGKDTVTGHWEMMGIHTAVPFPTYPNGFPKEVIGKFEKAIGTKTLGNYPASGTEIIKALGEEHMRTGYPIVYTSADSVFQIAAHEGKFGLDRLYEISKIAREQLVAPNNVARVIARPFVGDTPHAFSRTQHRKDFPLVPPRNVIDLLAEAGVKVQGVGVIGEVFAGRGFDKRERTQTNEEHFQALLRAMDGDAQFIFVNFEDFDMLYGHRNDVAGFARCLEDFDDMIGQVMAKMRPTDLLIITADHGNDPTTPSTDHSREYVPLLVYSPSFKEPRDLGTRSSFADVGATVAEVFGVSAPMGNSVTKYQSPN